MSLLKPQNDHMEDWTSDYVRGLKALGGKNEKLHQDEVRRGRDFLNRLSVRLERSGRGSAWIPEPDETGYYPVVEEVPFEALKTAIRKNTGSQMRGKAWERIKGNARQFKPLRAPQDSPQLDRHQFNKMMEHVAIAMPEGKGRHPKFLGEKVPGEIQVGNPGRSVATMEQLGPDWNRGFTMRKFSERLVPLRYLSSAAERQAQEMNATNAHVERFLTGKEDMSVAEAQKLARKLTPRGTKVLINKDIPSLFDTTEKQLEARPRRAIIAHEAKHARDNEQHPFLMPASVAVGGAATGIGTVWALGQSRQKPDTRGSRRFTRRAARAKWPIAAVAAGQLPTLAWEARANNETRKHEGGWRTAAGSMGSYVAGAAGAVGLAAGARKVGLMRRKAALERLRRSKAAYAADFAEGFYIPDGTHHTVMNLPVAESDLRTVGRKRFERGRAIFKKGAINAGGAMLAAAVPTIGFMAGRETAKRDVELSPNTQVVVRNIPGYMDGLAQGQIESAKKEVKEQRGWLSKMLRRKEAKQEFAARLRPFSYAIGRNRMTLGPNKAAHRSLLRAGAKLTPKSQRRDFFKSARNAMESELTKGGVPAVPPIPTSKGAKVAKPVKPGMGKWTKKALLVGGVAAGAGVIHGMTERATRNYASPFKRDMATGGLTVLGLGVAHNRSLKKQENEILGKESGPLTRHPILGGLAAVGGALGTAAAIKHRVPQRALAAIKKRRAAAIKPEQYFFDGFRAKMKEFGRSWRNEGWPTVKRGMVVGGLTAGQTEIGLPAMTVDGIAIRRSGVNSSYSRFTNTQLQMMLTRLEMQKSQLNDEDQEEKVDEEIRSIKLELMQRRSMVGL